MAKRASEDDAYTSATEPAAPRGERRIAASTKKRKKYGVGTEKEKESLVDGILQRDNNNCAISRRSQSASWRPANGFTLQAGHNNIYIQ